MPKPPRKQPGSIVVVCIVLGSVAALCLLGCLGVGAYFLLNQGPALGLPGRAALDPDSMENTRMWAEDAVKRLKEAESSKDAAKANAEVARVENQLKTSLLGKKVRWALPVAAVAGGEVKFDPFFGTAAGTFRSEDPKMDGKPLRRLYLRVYFGAEEDGVMVGGEVTQAQADRLKKGSTFTVARTVTQVMLTKHDDRWVSVSNYREGVDALEPYCVTIVVERK